MPNNFLLKSRKLSLSVIKILLRLLTTIPALQRIPEGVPWWEKGKQHKKPQKINKQSMMTSQKRPKKTPKNQ